MVKRVFNYGASLLYGIGSLLIPKKKNYYVFRLFHDPAHFAGNVKALLLYIQRTETGVNAVLLTQHKEVQEQARDAGITTVSGQLKCFWTTLRAEHLIIDSYTGLYRRGSFSLVQLGHGAGYKNLGLLRDDLSDSRRKRLQKIYQNYSLVVTTSPSNLKKKNDSFHVQTGVITGLPRNDVFFENNGELIRRRKADLGLTTCKKIIGYAPTFRDYDTKPPFSERFWEDLQNELEAREMVFIVKKHPWDHLLEIPDQFPNIREVSKVLTAEELILLSDELVTDYSSIATDFALTGKPILIYAYDYEEYKRNCRSIYYDLEKVLPRPFLTRESELLEIIKNPDRLERQEVKDRYLKFQREFHQYRDGNSSQRVLAEIQKL